MSTKDEQIKQAHALAMELTKISEMASVADKAIKEDGTPGRMALIQLPASSLLQYGETARKVLRLFSDMGLIDRAAVQKEFDDTYTVGGKASVAVPLGDVLGAALGGQGINGLIETIRETVAQRAAQEEAGEECDCPACTLRRQLMSEGKDPGDKPVLH